MIARTLLPFVLLSAGVLCAGNGAAAPDNADESARLRTIADDIYAWQIEREPQVRLAKGLPVTQLPRVDAASAREAAQFARTAGERLAQLQPARPSHSDELFRQLLSRRMQITLAEEQFRPLVFLVTPYQGGDIHQLVFRILSAHPLSSAKDGAGYLALVRDYSRLLDEIYARSVEQRAAGILLPKAAIPQALELCKQLDASLVSTVELTAQRVAALPAPEAKRLRAQVHEVVIDDLAPRIDRLRSLLDAGYVAAAPQTVGLSQYPQGLLFYRHLIRAYTGLDLTPEQVHQVGVRALADIDGQLAAIRTELGFTGSREQFEVALKADPRWTAATPAEVEARYMGYIRRIEPYIAEYFSRLPKSGYGVKRLDAAAEPGMTYGYYQAPGAAEPTGYYRYNGSGLDKRTLATAQHLIYHELIPGHHFQIALEREATDAHPLRAFIGSTAYVEGWAEYAAELANEMQLYEPHERYGHLMMRSFTATRLVVDTGLNALGWSLDQAREAMRRGTMEADAQIDSELLRYSTDIPGQALGYYLGYDKFRELRERAQRELGATFDRRAFNDSLLTTGQVSLDVLQSHVDWFIAQAKGSAPPMGGAQTGGGAAATDTQADGGTAGTASQPRHIAAMNIARVKIARPAREVWAALFDRSHWMPAFGSKHHMTGPVNATGDVSLYTLKDFDGNTAQRLEEVLLAVPNERLAIRLAPQDGSATYAVAEYRLSGSARTTNLDFTVYWWETIPPPVTEQRAHELEAQYTTATQKKIDGDLERLKVYLEAKH